MEELLHQLIGGSSHYLQGVLHPRWCRISSINSRNKHVYIYIHTPPKKTKHFFRKICWRLHDSTFVFFFWFFGRGGRLEVKPGSTRWVVATLPKDSLQIGMAKHGERSDASSFKLMIHSCRGLPKPRFRVGRYIISVIFMKGNPFLTYPHTIHCEPMLRHGPTFTPLTV